MREIVPRKRRGDRRGSFRAAYGYALRDGWPVLPGVAAAAGGRCRCGRPACPVPGAHPGGPDVPDLPELLAATTDPRMVRWWWTVRPQAPVLLATGGRAPCALSLPAPSGRRALSALELLGTPLGPVLVSPERLALLVAPYEAARLGEVLCGLLEAEHRPGPGGGEAVSRLPDGLRFHGAGGYLPLPPSSVGRGRVHWLRPPRPARDGERFRFLGPGGRQVQRAGVAARALPEATDLLGALLDADRLGLLAGPGAQR